MEKRKRTARIWNVPRMGRMPPTPAVFVRVANKGHRAYGTWKKIRKTVDGGE
jgi:hypothetical protein